MSPLFERQRQLDGELEKTILRGLFCEWEAALGSLRPEMRCLMRPPIFGVSGAPGTWGTWNASTRELSLSRRLILDHPWDAVREVLLHETAHQLAEEVLGGGGQRPHGPAFREACRMLGANPRASGNFKTLDQRIREDGSESGADALLTRIRKLLALAGSPHRREAEAAMAKAHELMNRYNVELVASGEERSFESVFAGKPALRHHREEVHLGNLLQDYYFVRCVWVPAYVFQKQKMGRVLELSGTVRNLALAHYVYDYVKGFIDGEWRVYNTGKGLNRRRKTDFAVGVIEGFRRKLDGVRSVTARRNGDGALRTVTDARLGRYLRERYPCLRTERRGGIRRDPAVHRDGVAAGEGLVIRKGVGERGGRGGLLTER